MVRFKNRYLLIKLRPFIVDEKDTVLMEDLRKTKKQKIGKQALLPPLTTSNVALHLRQSIAENYGTVGAAVNALAFSVKYCNALTRTVIVRCARENELMVRTSIILCTTWPQKASAEDSSIRCGWQVTHVAGTIRSCQTVAIKIIKKELAATVPANELQMISADVVHEISELEA